MKIDPPSPSLRRGKQFFAELKRRNVYKVAVAYAVVAWLLVQAASILFPTFEAPSWVMKAFVAIVLLGFPLALLFAWAFELTPEGLKRTEEVAPPQSISRKTGRKLIAIIAALAAVALALLVFQGRLSQTGANVTSSSTSPSSPSTAIAEKSIAVLPFENLSEEKANAYFADGVQDEILTNLARIADLKVISRTSVMQYQGATQRNLREIGQQLGVAHVVEGSVQRADRRVRVNAQLIDARNDAHLWAQTYDRDLADVFAIQSEIAKAIAEQLQAKLSPREKSDIEQPPTTDIPAFELYSRARDLLSDFAAGSPQNLLAAMTCSNRRWRETLLSLLPNANSHLPTITSICMASITHLPASPWHRQLSRQHSVSDPMPEKRTWRARNIFTPDIPTTTERSLSLILLVAPCRTTHKSLGVGRV